jgi:thiol-disulfide isomerase/thioredoxin
MSEVHMPSLDGATEWLNSEPLGPAQLRGRVVLVNFWTLTCINWLRTEPWVRAWSQAYQHDGLVVVGVHAPEFSFEHDVRNVQRSIVERGIEYPVVLDNDFQIWRAFDNHYWPALYFVDSDGVIRDEYFGEGRYDESEAVIQSLLGIEKEPVSVVGSGVEAPADWDHLRSPETYLGFDRQDRFASPEDEARDGDGQYRLAGTLRPNQWGLSGHWTIEAERAVLHEGGGNIAMRFHARDVHLVLSSKAPEPLPFRVTLDGEPPGTSRGVDVDEEGNGELGDGRMYQLLRQAGEIVDRTVEVSFSERNAEAYVFTFG